MALLKIEDAVFKNEDGKLVSEEVTMVGYEVKENEEKPTMKVIPIVGDKFTEFVKLTNLKKGDKEADGAEDKLIEILIEHIEEPKFTPQQFKLIRPIKMGSILKTVMFVSGVPLDKLEITEVKMPEELPEVTEE